jgi:hypothetical protein
LFAQFGAAAAYLSLGLLMLSHWQKIMKQSKKFSAWAHMKQAELQGEC